MLPAFTYFQYFQKNYNRQISQNNLQAVTNLGKTIDDKIMKDFIRISDLYLTQRQSNETLVYPLHHDVTDDPVRIQQISTRLKEIKNNYPYINSIDIYYRNNDLIFLDSNACFMKNQECLSGQRKERFDLYNTSAHSYKWLHGIDERSNKKVLTYVRSIPFYSSANHYLGIVAINVNEQVVREVFLQQSSAFDGHQLWLIDEHGNLISRNRDDGEQEVPQSVVESLLKQAKSTGTGMLSAEINGEYSVISFVKSEHSPWYYISVASVNDFYKRSTDLLKVTILIGALMLFVNVIFVLMLTRRAHRPIGSAFRQLNSELQEMKDRWDRSKIIIRHDYLLKLLKGRLGEGEDISKNEHSLEFNFDRKECFSFVIDLEHPPMSFKDEQLLVYQIIEELGAMDMENTASVYAVNRDSRKIAGIATFDGDADFVIQHIESTLKKHSSVMYCLAIGNAYMCNALGISCSYKEAEEALSYRFLNEGNLICYSELNIDDRIELNPAIPLLMEEVGESIDSVDGRRLKQIVSRIILEMEQQSNQITVAYCQEILHSIVKKINMAIPRLGIQAKDVADYDLREFAKKMNSLSAFGNWLNEIIDKLIVSIDDKNKASEIPMEIQIKKYIHDHLFDNLSLDSISNHFGVSPNYFSKMFKLVIGVTFIEYVMDLKMHAAAQMLLTKQWSVQQISERLGYTSTPHFIRIFKSKYGQTPKQYQRYHTKDVADLDS